MKKYMLAILTVVISAFIFTQVCAWGEGNNKPQADLTQTSNNEATTFINNYASKEKKIEIDGKTILLSYVESHRNYIDSDEFDFVDSYESQDYSALYKGNTDECIGFCRFSLDGDESKVKINKASAKKLSDKYLADFIGQDSFKQYSFTNVWYSESENKYKISYISKIKDYLTDDLSMVCLTGGGELISVSAIKHGRYSGAKWDKKLDKYENKVNKLRKKSKANYGEFSFLSEPFLSYDKGTKVLSFKQKDLKTNEIEPITLEEDYENEDENDVENDAITSWGKVVLAKRLKMDAQKVKFVLKNGNDEAPLKTARITVKLKKKGRTSYKTFTRKGRSLKKFDIKVKLKKNQYIKSVDVKAGFKRADEQIKGYFWETYSFKASK